MSYDGHVPHSERFYIGFCIEKLIASLSLPYLYFNPILFSFLTYTA